MEVLIFGSDTAFTDVRAAVDAESGLAAQANLMEGLFGPAGSCAFTSPFIGRGGGGIRVLSSVLGLAAHANEMQRFFSRTSTAGSFRCSPNGEVNLIALGLAGANATLGSLGLGEFVRGGVVIPVPQVRSAVDAMLIVLVIDRRLRL